MGAMTPPRKPSARLTEDEAREILYGPGVKNFTVEGYQEAIGLLRASAPALARRVERALKSYLATRIFPRRQRRWQDTSEGLRARLMLLPENPHVEQDASAIRTVLGITPDLLDGPYAGEAWEKLGKMMLEPDQRRAVFQLNLVAWWRSAHEKTAMGYVIAGEDAAELQALLLGAFDIAVASARIDLSAGAGAPDWLCHPGLGSAAPLNRAVVALLVRHRLPPTRSLEAALAAYVLTSDRTYLEGRDFALTLLDMASLTDAASDAGGTFTVIVGGLDEYVGRDDWMRIWDRGVRPRQEWLWRARGGRPSGKHGPDLERLHEGIPLYREWLRDPSRNLERVLSDVSESGIEVKMEVTTVRHVLRDLEDLLRPIEPAQADGGAILTEESPPT